MQKGKKNKDGKFPTQSYSKISSGSSIIILCVIVNSNKQRARGLRLAFCSLLLLQFCCLQQHLAREMRVIHSA